ncbi:MAG: P-II family nitrogen regulator [Tissierellia bacterium]|nr:P-II family nitrogen regulator [Tissierellia bacterium]
MIHPYNTSLFFVIVDRGKASTVLKEAKKHGVTGGTIFYGMGTVRDSILHFLEINEVRKEVLLMVVSQETEITLHKHLTDTFSFQKPGKGICFSSPINQCYGTSQIMDSPGERSGKPMEYQAIFAIVDNHKGTIVVDAAQNAGAKGATIIHARGSGVHEKTSFFNFNIEPEKEIVLILIQKNKTEEILAGIKKEIDIEQPGTGILFTLDVSNASGLVDIEK